MSVRHQPRNRPSHLQRTAGVPSQPRGRVHPGYIQEITEPVTYLDIPIGGIDPSIGVVPGDKIGEGTIPKSKFVESLRPPEIVDVLPTIPDGVNYPVGSIVFYTVDKKLYRVPTTDATTWSKEVDGADVKANSILAGSIEAGAIGAREIGVGNLTGAFITNAGFETGTSVGWGLYDPSSCAAWGVETVESAGAPIGTGTYQCSFTRNGPGTDPQVVSLSYFSVKPGQRVSFSALVKSGTAPSRLIINWSTNTGTGYLTRSQLDVPLGASGWYVLHAEVPAGARFGYVGIEHLGSSYPSWVAFDDVRVSVGDLTVTSANGNVIIDQGGVTINGGVLTTRDSSGNVTIQGGVVKAAGIEAGAVVAGKIAAGAVTAGTVAANAINADHLAIGGAGSIVPITNGDFETGDFTGWGTAGSSTYVESSPSGWQGAYRCVIYKSSGDAYAFIDQRSIPVRYGEVVTFSARFGYAASPATARMQLVLLNSVGGELAYPQTDIYISSEQTVNAAFSISHADARYVALRIFNVTDGTYLVVDDVSLSRAINLANSDGTVYINSGGIQITNGKLTVYNDGGSTVIIDGLSNMFKISATGTVGRTFANALDTENTQTVLLSALGNGFSTPPAMQCNMFGTWGNERWPSMVPVVVSGTRVWAGLGSTRIRLSSGTPEIVIGAFSSGTNLSSWIAYTRYYVLKEAGI